MKKIIPIAALLITLFSINAVAQPKTPSAVVTSFGRTYSNAERPTWTIVDDLYRVDFTLQNENLTAFYKPDGELVASSRNITTMQLPISLKLALGNHFGNYNVSSLFEIDGHDGICYYARASDQKSEILLQSTSFGDWVVKR